MFANCFSLNTLNINSFTSENLEDKKNIFYNIDKECKINCKDGKILSK